MAFSFPTRLCRKKFLFVKRGYLKAKQSNRQSKFALPAPASERESFLHVPQTGHSHGSQERTDSEHCKCIRPTESFNHIRNEVNRDESEKESETRLDCKHCAHKRRF